jgi:transposase
MSKPITNTTVAGIDVSKRTLDVAVTGSDARFTAANDEAGHAHIAGRLRALGVGRVGMEASGHYEAAVAAHLRKSGFEVVILDPAQVHGYRRFRKQRAKTDPIDAQLIAVVTAAIETVREAPDERLAAFAEHLTLIEQIGEDIARLNTRLDRFADKMLRRLVETEIERLRKRRDKQLRRLLLRLAEHDDLARRLALLQSIPGIGVITAVTLVVRMPELGRMSRGEAAALVGVAPFNLDSGEHAGERRVQGGRKRLRRAVFLAAFAASQRWNPILVALYRRLLAAGKHHKLAVIACTRKLVEIANSVLARATPWKDSPPKPNPA